MPRHEGRGRVDALGAQDMGARRRFGQHREVAAGHDRQGDHAARPGRARGVRRDRRSGVPGRRAAAPVRGLVRCTIRRRYLFFLTAVSPNIWRTLSTPRPRTSSRSCSSSGQVPSSTSGAIWVNSGASSATRRWPRVTSSSASSLLPGAGLAGDEHADRVDLHEDPVQRHARRQRACQVVLQVVEAAHGRAAAKSTAACRFPRQGDAGPRGRAGSC